LPCPAADYFYPEHVIDQNVAAERAFEVVFSLTTIFTIVTYIVIPGKRRFPQNLILAMAVALLFLYLPDWIGIFVGLNNVACDNQYDAVSSNPICCSRYEEFVCLIN
jgi:hypothetical protein